MGDAFTPAVPAFFPDEYRNDPQIGPVQDEGTAKIQAAFAATAGVGVSVGDDTGSVGGSLLTVEQDRRRLAEAFYRAVHSRQLHPAVQAGNGTIDDPQSYGPPPGVVWCFRRLTAVSFSAGSVTVYDMAPPTDSSYRVTFNQAGTYTFGRGEMLLFSGQRLVFVAAGITGNVTISGAFDEVAQWAMPKYLGGSG